MQLRYEETDQQFNDLPMPDEEASWQKMKELLEEEDDNDILPPPVFFHSCLGWGLLFSGLIAAWLIIRPEKRWSENTGTYSTSSSKERPHQNRTIVNPSKKTDPEKINPSSSSSIKKLSDKKKSPVANIPNENEDLSLSKHPLSRQALKNGAAKTLTAKNKNSKLPTRETLLKNQIARQPDGRKDANAAEKKDENRKDGNQQIDASVVITNQQRDSTAADTTTIAKDTATKEKETHPSDSASQKKAQPPKNKTFLTAGIGEQQQIPIGGQTAVPYSHYGRKGSLSDYVPSVYVRLQKEKKWFAQAEFRYGAAQSVKEFSYNRKTSFDAATKEITTVTMRLKKTYYHQLPLSFNYYVRPDLSIGIGGMYSRFYGAIAEEETKTQNLVSGRQTIFKEIIPIRHFTDSFLYKTQVHVLVQADYQWKKFSFGLRYTKDIQPYIKYTRPDGTIEEEKNQSLQFLIRYQLWRSGKS